MEELGLLAISKCNRNVPILVKTRGQPTSDELPLARYGIFLIIEISASFLAKMAIFEGNNGIEVV